MFPVLAEQIVLPVNVYTVGELAEVIITELVWLVHPPVPVATIWYPPLLTDKLVHVNDEPLLPAWGDCTLVLFTFFS